jgi:hypothetical protein
MPNSAARAAYFARLLGCESKADDSDNRTVARFGVEFAAL